jgi:hypothetical protein
MWETGWCFWQIGQNWNHCQLIAGGRDSANDLLAQRSGCYARQDSHLLRLLDEIDNLVDWRRGNFFELVKSIEKCGGMSLTHRHHSSTQSYHRENRDGDYRASL